MLIAYGCDQRLRLHSNCFEEKYRQIWLRLIILLDTTIFFCKRKKIHFFPEEGRTRPDFAEVGETEDGGILLMSCRTLTYSNFNAVTASTLLLLLLQLIKAVLMRKIMCLQSPPQTIQCHLGYHDMRLRSWQR